MNARLVEIESQAEQDWILSINGLSLVSIEYVSYRYLFMYTD